MHVSSTPALSSPKKSKLSYFVVYTSMLLLKADKLFEINVLFGLYEQQSNHFFLFHFFLIFFYFLLKEDILLRRKFYGINFRD